MVAFAQANLPKDASILQCITQDAELHFGVYADVIAPGRVAIGDRVYKVN